MSKKKPITKRNALQVNLGSGANLLDGFINVDIVVPPGATPSNFLQGKANNLPFEKDSVDYILMDNVFEHIPMKDQPAVLFEIKRVLKPGGRCVIAVPHFNGLIRSWVKMQEQGFNIFTFKWLAEEIYGNQSHEGEYHCTPMTPEYLNWLMSMVGLNHGRMIVYQEGAPGPASGEFPGINPKNLPTTMRHDTIYVDIYKEINP